jgi:caffeoyl-CoA O-methyltransferase
MESLQPRAVADYLTELAVREHLDPVLEEMELRAEEQGFPIVGRAAGGFLDLASRMVGARRVMELGSGFGYSAWFFAGAVGGDGEVVCTDLDADHASLAEAYLRRSDRWSPVRWVTGDALQALREEPGEFDVIFCDVDKEHYPDAWLLAAERLRVGGLWICDNVLWDGRAAGLDLPADPGRDAVTGHIREMTRLVVADERYRSSIVPLRDGLQVAVRIS